MLQLTIPVYLIKCHHREILSTNDDEWCEECVKWIRADRRIRIGIGVEWDECYGVMITPEIVSQMSIFRRGRKEG